MAFPDNTLSSIPLESAFLGSRGYSQDPTIDYEDGGIDFNDPSEGHFYQWWRARIEDNKIIVDSKYNEDVVMYEGADVTEVSLSFDQNMRPNIAYVDEGRAYLIWYNTVTAQQETMTLPVDVITPRISLDDKRRSQTSISDVILAYMRGGQLRIRLQRDRFEVEYDPTLEVPEPMRTQYRDRISSATGLIKIGMGHELRLLFQFKLPDPYIPVLPECSIDGEL